MDVVQPRWSTWSFLLYAGVFTILGAAGETLSYLSGQYGQAAYSAWALLLFALLLSLALILRRRGHAIAAGLFALAAVAAFAGFLVALLTWWGWLGGTSSAFGGFHVGKLVVELLVLAAALTALRSFRFPLLMSVVVGAAWLFVTDLLSGGGNWSAWVTLLIGLVYLAMGVSLDGGARRPYGFWAHLAAGLAIGGAFLYFWHASVWNWVLIVLAALLYVRLARATSRSSWAVLGAVGLLAATEFYAGHWDHAGGFLGYVFITGLGVPGTRPWVTPLAFAICGFVLVALGLWVCRTRRLPA
jgi:hypothetical protein